MGQSLKEIAQQLRDTDKKVQLIYAFNGVGKTRLSCEFKELIAPKDKEEHEGEKPTQILYYNAFTEDLFYWDNKNRKLIIQPNSFTDWILKTLRDQGIENNIIKHFQRYTSNKLTPMFNETYNEITFSIASGDDDTINNIKISKGEESCLIWCIFYSLLDQAVIFLNMPESEKEETNPFENLKYVFIDDPVSSLDENHLIELAVNIGQLITSSPKDLHFIISTHNPAFYNVLYTETNNKSCYLLSKNNDGTYNLLPKDGCSNQSFSYHHYLRQIIQEAIDSHSIQKYHFMLLRNLYEKTAHFLGYPDWADLLPKDKESYYRKIIHFTCHSKLSTEVVAEPTEPEKKTLELLFRHLIDNNYWKEKDK